MWKKFLSRKLAAVVVAVLGTPFLTKLGAPPETIDWVLTTIVTYIVGQSAVDTASAFKGAKVE